MCVTLTTSTFKEEISDRDKKKASSQKRFRRTYQTHQDKDSENEENRQSWKDYWKYYGENEIGYGPEYAGNPYTGYSAYKGMNSCTNK